MGKVKIDTNLYEDRLLEGKVYYSRFKIGGHDTYVNLTEQYGVKNITQARKKRDELKVEKRRERYKNVENKKIPVVQLIEDTLKSKERGDRDKFKTYSYTYGSTFKNHVKLFLNKYRDFISQKELKAIKEHLDSKGRGISEYKKVIVLLNMVKVQDKEFEVPKWFKALPENEIKVSRKHEITDIFLDPLPATTKSFYHFILNIKNSNAKYSMLLLLMCGRRVNEVLTLTKSNVDLNNCTITSIVTKNGKPSTYNIPNEVLIFLKKRLKTLKANEKIFEVSELTLRYYFKKHLQTLNTNTNLLKGVNLHSFRKLMGTVLFDMDIQEATIGALLSHSSKSVTGLYAKVTPEKKKETLNIYWQILRGSS
ncbi:hypothetical protein MNB_SV-3-913 [hydrothermal vent metagenome]|uniref:Tyr recombinase domain-containing protein n=1 Tax=hydrothermal vent metagenome TaxID=652676 RepID=A0A1W1BER3_9ZZZZ